MRLNGVFQKKFIVSPVPNSKYSNLLKALPWDQLLLLQISMQNIKLIPAITEELADSAAAEEENADSAAAGEENADSAAAGDAQMVREEKISHYARPCLPLTDPPGSRSSFCDQWHLDCIFLTSSNP